MTVVDEEGKFPFHVLGLVGLEEGTEGKSILARQRERGREGEAGGVYLGGA